VWRAGFFLSGKGVVFDHKTTVHFPVPPQAGFFASTGRNWMIFAGSLAALPTFTFRLKASGT
jgi:hypothetical protein